MVFDKNKQSVPPAARPHTIRIVGAQWTVGLSGGIPVPVVGSPIPPSVATLGVDLPDLAQYDDFSNFPAWSSECLGIGPPGPGVVWTIIFGTAFAQSDWTGPPYQTGSSPVGSYTATDPDTVPQNLMVFAF